MTKFGAPPSPSELAKIPPEVHRLAAGTKLWRVYFRGGRHPYRWNEFRADGPTNSRFDHHEPVQRGRRRIRTGSRREIYYAALHPVTCLAEVFQTNRSINPVRNEPWLVGFEIQQPLELLDLTELWPTQTGLASSVINSGPRPRSRQWSSAIYAAYPNIPGLYYRAAMTSKPAVALYERANTIPGLFSPRPSFHRGLADRSWSIGLHGLAAEINYRVLYPLP